MHLLSFPRRSGRTGEWTPAKAVTFIVTLAATRSVTFAALEAGMRRKSAYALKGRDPAFACAWAAAMQASKGNKVKEVEDAPVPTGHGDTAPLRIDRERAFVRLVAKLRESPSLAPRARAQ